MNIDATDSSAESDTAHFEQLLIYDGDCSFCSLCAMWVGHRVPRSTRIIASQSMDNLAEHGLTERDASSAAYWIDTSGRPWRGARGIARALMAIGGVWKFVGAIMDAPIVRWFSAAGYLTIVKFRRRLPGGSLACRIDSSASSDTSD
ncbi:MAG: thiol-disulfide oxidoreductase DCC family protein [Candidatus Dormibacteraceae bacterium]